MSGESVLTCAQTRELAPELALGILGGAERAEVVLHVNGCARCQAAVSELTEVADTIPQLVPEAEPPRGFEAGVMRRLGEDDRRTRRRWLAAVATVAAAVAILSIVTVRVIESNQSTPASTATAAPIAVAMRGSTADTAAGWAYVSGGHGVAISVDYGVPSGDYTVRVVPARGDAATIGTMSVAGGRGSWTGSSATPLVTDSRIALVDAEGSEVCHGTVSSAE